MSRNSRTINISLPKKLLDEIDRAAADEYASRSDFIRESIVRKLKGQRVVDEWGDEGEWETVVDFRDINPDGVPIEKVMVALERLKEADEQNRKASPKIRR